MEACVAAGYVAVRPAPRPEWADPLFVADPIVSLSHCLVALGPPVAWLNDVQARLSALGVPDNEFAAATAWLEEHEDDVGFPAVWRDPATLVEFASRFGADGLRVIGAGIPTDRAAGFVADYEAGIGQADGIVELVKLGLPLKAGGRALGWEPLCADVGGIGCSWTCNHLQVDVDAIATLALNEFGLIERRDDAQRAMDALDRLEGKEPGLWEAFLLVEYLSDR